MSAFKRKVYPKTYARQLQAKLFRHVSGGATNICIEIKHSTGTMTHEIHSVSGSRHVSKKHGVMVFKIDRSILLNGALGLPVFTAIYVDVIAWIRPDVLPQPGHRTNLKLYPGVNWRTDAPTSTAPIITTDDPMPDYTFSVLWFGVSITNESKRQQKAMAELLNFDL